MRIEGEPGAVLDVLRQRQSHQRFVHVLCKKLDYFFQMQKIILYCKTEKLLGLIEQDRF